MTEGKVESLTHTPSNNKVNVVMMLSCPDAEKLCDAVMKPQS